MIATPTYSLEFSVSEAARILQVAPDLIKTWAYNFRDYVSKAANPAKGMQKRFTLDDIRVFAYVYEYWEEEPDMENIRWGLNSNSHFDHELIDNLIMQATPLFIERPENMDESWRHGVLHGGMAEIADRFVLANAYKLAGDRLIETALQNEEVQQLFYPAIYNYRHAIELYLKALTEKHEQSHDLAWLYSEFVKVLKEKFNQAPPDWFENLIATFHDFDPYGTSFRYGGNTDKGEVFVDYYRLKKHMAWAGEGFRNIRRASGLPDADY